MIYSDHKAVMCKHRISAPPKKWSTSRQKLAKLNHNYPNIQDSLILKKLSINHETNYKYDELGHVIKNAAHETLPKRNCPQSSCFKQNEVSLKSLIEKRNSDLSLKISGLTRSSS